MAYASWSVVFGEQPSAAKWNILGTNDASFNDGSGISGLTMGAITAVKNSYKFSVYRNAAQNTTGGSYAVVLFDTKTFDTGTNVDVVTNKGRFTAPIGGFYHFDAMAGIPASSSTTIVGLALFKNGSAISYGSQSGTTGGTGSQHATASELLQLSANDYVEIYLFCNATTSIEVGATTCHFSGQLVSTT